MEHEASGVLVLDDEEMLVDLICRMLRSCHMTTIPFASSPEALDALGDPGREIPAVVLDHGIHGSRGVYERASERGIPVVLISGDADARQDAPFDAVPDERFLLKPFTIAQIAGVLRPLLEDSAADGTRP